MDGEETEGGGGNVDVADEEEEEEEEDEGTRVHAHVVLDDEDDGCNDDEEGESLDETTSELTACADGILTAQSSRYSRAASRFAGVDAAHLQSSCTAPGKASAGQRDRDVRSAAVHQCVWCFCFDSFHMGGQGACICACMLVRRWRRCAEMIPGSMFT